ncbi:transporter substrate-binding domain-containing protein [Pseudovibrio sp. Tun.PSC04-5.I4]|uniref:transporter substrate-binding domain-containing protein n=1 Tax=Pseudovibrio sp. Tun.PSC04-5.I4 TaxID=1798213 RepID=UPI00089023E3|nr:transporter substrate-binding domain-containing protein [Pseudovibrio sp. Tun.PSC04-5.I4]SDR33719.1 amino acid ABC transporter substrate-binding protein, PAAT family [Pseudovibrio sp. Tun.PSC04-5.I4]
MKLKALLGTLGVAALTTLSVANAADAVRVGIAPEPYLPFSTLTSAGEWQGFEPDLLRALCDEAKIECSFNAVAWDGLIPSLKEDKLDLIVGAFSINEERQKVVDFSTPYVFEASVVVGMKSDSTDVAVKADPNNAAGKVIDDANLSGMLLGTQAASVQSVYADTYLTEMTTKYYDTADNVVADLTSGRLDYALLPEAYVGPFLETANGADYAVKAVVPSNSVLGNGIGMAVNKGNAELMGKLNAGLAALQASGKLEAITVKWFPVRK